MRLLALLLLVAAVHADTETARFFVQRAERALEDGQLDKAIDFAERALKEEEGFLPAVLIQAKVAQRRGNKDDAIRRLEAILAKRGSAHGVDEGRAIKAAEEIMAKLDAAGVEFRKIRDEYVKKLLALARSSERRKPQLANACYRQILAVQSDHKIALDKLKAQPAAKKKSPVKARGKALFNGKNLEGWTGKAPVWKVEDRIIHARMERIAQINRYKDEFKGDYEFICELRIVETLGNDPLVGMLFGGRSSYDQFGLWIWHDSVRLERQTGEHERSELQRKSLRRIGGNFTREKWHTYKVAREGKRITAFVDGKEIFSFSGADRSLDGFVGIWAQDSLVEIRSIRLAR